MSPRKTTHTEAALDERDAPEDDLEAREEDTDEVSDGDDDALASVAAPLRDALLERGYTALTPVQRAVSDVLLSGQNLRISSQTGSGKTVALGIALAEFLLATEGEGRKRPAGPPRVLVVAPTRELANQVRDELAWLYAKVPAEVAVVTGGTSLTAERRALSRRPEVVVGTPGRTLDHHRAGALDLSQVAAVVLDEADQMLDLGFRDELEAILQALPTTRRTHLVSATFPEDVLALAERYQGEHVHVAGTPLGDANADIEHIVHIVHEHERLNALTNVLLSRLDQKALVFARTRADVGDLAQELVARGFSAAALTGEMEQRARSRTLDAFRSGSLRVLVATDVAARGLDVADLSMVVHYDAPDRAEPYTHRAGRTGRAGQKGTSITLVSPRFRNRPQRVLRELGVRAVWAPAPDASAVRAAESERVLAAARSALASVASSDAGAATNAGAASGVDERARAKQLEALAAKLLEAHEAPRLVAWLLARSNISGPCAPASITNVQPPKGREANFDSRAPTRRAPGGFEHRGRSRGAFELFEINWGERDGADVRRLTAVLCRKGDISGGDLGAIEIGRGISRFEVASDVASHFARAVTQPDRRDPHLRVRRVETVAQGRVEETARHTLPPPHARAQRDERSEPASRRGYEERTERAPRSAPAAHEEAPRARATQKAAPYEHDKRPAREPEHAPAARYVTPKKATGYAKRPRTEGGYEAPRRSTSGKTKFTPVKRDTRKRG